MYTLSLGWKDPITIVIRQSLRLIRHITMVYMKRILIVLFLINLVSFMIETDAIISKIVII